MKKTYHLLRVAKLLENKYASQSIREVLENAAGYGVTSENGIMNFPLQAQTDKVDLSFNVTLSSKTFGGYDVAVSAPVVNPPQYAPNYVKLPEQIKRYLDKHADALGLYPGATEFKYENKPQEPGIASN